MQLIKEIEIKNFRSIDDVVFKSVKPLNFFHGSNDVGKSNVLRALNLFFNNKTNDDVAFDFDRDFCRSKLKEAEARKKENEKSKLRLVLSIKITFNTPDSYKRSLGKTFWVRKSWNKYGALEPYDTSIQQNKSHLLSKFLNGIRYHYVPAIKDNSILARLLEDVYVVLSGRSEFKETLQKFAGNVQKQTIALSKELENQLPLKSSNLIPPSDFSSLFKAQDFATATADGDVCSLLLQHGDGILVRHIPSILSFLAKEDADTKFHIWGFEEPENSLELNAAVSEANRFVEYAKRDNIQIFLTSHSPAFYSLKSDLCTKQFARKKRTTFGTVTQWAELHETEDITKFMGDHDAFNKLFSTFQLMRDLQESGEKYETWINNAKKPILFVEGESDKIILEAAARIYFRKKSIGDLPIIIYSCDGTAKMAPLGAKGIANLAAFLSGCEQNKMLFVLTDNDGAGRLTGKNPEAVNPSRWNTSERFVYWRRLPYSEEMVTKFTAAHIPEQFWPGVIENCFSIDFRKNAKVKRKYKAEPNLFPDIQEFAKTQIVNPATTNAWLSLISDKDFAYYLYSPDYNYKVPFAEFVAEQSLVDSSILDWTIPIFKELTEKIDMPR